MTPKLRILVVDEDKRLGESLISFLRKKGYEARAIQDSETALRELAPRPPHLVLLSLEMPAISGVPLFARIRELHPGIGVIAVTAEPSVASAIKAMKQDAIEYLIKPFSHEILLESVNRAVRARGLLRDLDERLRMAIGQRMRELRRAQGLTLKQLGNRANLSVSLISQIELGKTAASISTLYKIVTALGVTFSMFFGKMRLQ